MAPNHSVPAEQGTIAVTFGDLWPWPPAKRILLLSQIFGTCRVEVHLSPESAMGILEASVSDCDGGRAVQVRSCPIRVLEPCDLKVALSWGLPDDLSLACSGEVVGSSAPGNTTVDQLDVRKKDGPSSADLSDRNEAALKNRREAFALLRPKTGRRLADPHELVDALKQETNQLRDLLNLIQDGSRWHVGGLAARLRAMLARGGVAMKPLLQLVAGSVEVPLIVYVRVDMLAPADAPDAPGISFIQGVTLNQIDTGQSAADLDVWLDLPGARLGPRVYTNNEVLRAIADTVGSHIDPDIEPLVEFMRGLQSSDYAGASLNAVERWLGGLGMIAGELADRVIRAANSPIQE